MSTTTSQQSPSSSSPPSSSSEQQQICTNSMMMTTGFAAFWYIISGVFQPIIMEFCKNAGLADPSCQLYMVFYYLGPASVGLAFCCGGHDEDDDDIDNDNDNDTNSRRNNNNAKSKTDMTNMNNNETSPLLKNSSESSKPKQTPPSTTDDESNNESSNTEESSGSRLAVYFRSGCIALFDLFAQVLNYTGAGLAGPTIFAIVYSSVTVWTAVWSRIFLGRTMSCMQWVGVFTVFVGLIITALGARSVHMSSNVIHGLLLVLFGSMMHAMTYVMSEAIMTIGSSSGSKPLSVRANCATQGVVATLCFLIWQCLYTIPNNRFESHIYEPMKQSNTSPMTAILILLSFTLANAIHSFSYFYTLKNFPSGATSAGVMKGLQAVLVFILTHILFCGKTSGQEMCFTLDKFISLVTVVTGALIFGVAKQTYQATTPSQGSK